VSLSLVAEWVSLERLCSPFLDFSLEVGSEQDPIRLNLTGASGIKEFLLTELTLHADDD